MVQATKPVHDQVPISPELKKFMAERAALWETVRVQIIALPVGVCEIEVKEILWNDISLGVDGTEEYVVIKDQEGRVILLSEAIPGLGSRRGVKVGNKHQLAVVDSSDLKTTEIIYCKHLN